MFLINEKISISAILLMFLSSKMKRVRLSYFLPISIFIRTTLQLIICLMFKGNKEFELNVSSARLRCTGLVEFYHSSYLNIYNAYLKIVNYGSKIPRNKKHSVLNLFLIFQWIENIKFGNSDPETLKVKRHFPLSKGHNSWNQKIKYSQTCIKRSPLVHRKSGLLRQLTSKKRFISYAIFYDRTRKRWPFNAGDCLTEVTTWTSMTQIWIQDVLAVLSNLYIKGHQGNLIMCPLSAVTVYIKVKLYKWFINEKYINMYEAALYRQWFVI